MDRFEFIVGNKESLNIVQPMWEKLNNYHEKNSMHFSEKFRSFKFKDRKDKFANDMSLNVKIDLIKDNNKEEYIGYCISTMNIDLVGEVDSLFVDGEYRGHGLGEKLMERALSWMDENGAKKKLIVVAEGNENVIEFYKRYGFRTKKVTLEQVGHVKINNK